MSHFYDLRAVSSGAWIRTAADAVTAIAAIGGATVGGVWAYFRYRRQEPDVPRVNALVSATRFEQNGRDFLAVEVELRHTAGGRLRIERDVGFDPSQPVIEISRLDADGKVGEVVQPVLLTSVAVLQDQTELDAGEFARDHKVVPVGERTFGTIAYDVTLRLVAGWKDESWTWCANAIITIAGPDTATGAAVVGARAE